MAGEARGGARERDAGMSEEIAEQKRALRRQMREVRKQFSAEARAAASVALCAQLGREPVWREARRILAFAPLPDEPDVRPLWEAALREGRTVALPRFDAARGAYEVRQVRSMADLREAYFGILEPEGNSPLVELNQLDVMLIPGVAFDAIGRRLGRGKGYFDRLLSEVHGHKCGVAFEWQVVPAVPVEPHDISLNSLLTPSRWWRCDG